MNKNYLALLALFALSGCAGLPVGYGGTHAPIQSSSMSVTYLYDPLVGGRSAAMDAANEYCGRMGKTAMPSSSGNQGILQIQSYDCRSSDGRSTSAESQSDQLARKMKIGFENSGKCYKELSTSDIGEPVAKSILVMSDDQSNKYDLLSSKARLNDGQKKALKAFLTEAVKCRKMLNDFASGTPYAAPLAKRDTETDSIYAKLLAGQMTVGEANLARDQLRAKNRDEMMAVGKSLDADFKSSHNAEVSQDAESKRRLANTIRENQQAQQQQQIINQNQQIINNQKQQNTQPRTPVQTNCTNFGAGMINCTSY